MVSVAKVSALAKAPPPKPPSLPTRPLFSVADFRAAGALPSTSNTPTSSPTTQYTQPQLPMISLADTIADVYPFIPILLDLGAHNYYH